MTEDKIALRALLEKGSDATFLREMNGFAAERLMQLETEGLCGAAPGERTAERRNQRNGYRNGDWETRAGTVELRIPKLRRGSYFPAFLVLCTPSLDRSVTGCQSRRVGEPHCSNCAKPPTFPARPQASGTSGRSNILLASGR